MTVRDYSTTPAENNDAPPNGFPEGQAASTVNDSARQLMAEVRETFEEAPYFDFGDDPTRVDNDTFTVAGDLTARYPVGNRVKLVGATTGFGRITVSSHAAGTTTIDVVMDSGNVPLTLARVAVQPTATFGTATIHTIGSTSIAGAPTWTAVHKFTRFGGAGTGLALGLEHSTNPGLYLKETGGAVDNKTWDILLGGEQFRIRAVNDADSVASNVMTVDRTGTTVDIVSFPTDNAAGNFRVGPALSATINNARMTVRSASSGVAAAQFTNGGGTGPVVAIHNVDTANDNGFLSFLTEAAGTVRGSITYNRGGGVVAYNTTCREGLKRNIRGSAAALPLLMQIQVVAFEWRDSAARLPYFVTYERMESVVPWACQNDGVDVSKLVPLTIKGVQEHESELQSLRAQLAELASRVTALEQGGGVTEVKPR